MVDVLIGLVIGYVVAHIVSVSTLWGWLKALYAKITTSTPTPPPAA